MDCVWMAGWWENSIWNWARPAGARGPAGVWHWCRLRVHVCFLFRPLFSCAQRLQLGHVLLCMSWWFSMADTLALNRQQYATALWIILFLMASQSVSTMNWIAFMGNYQMPQNTQHANLSQWQNWQALGSKCKPVLLYETLLWNYEHAWKTCRHSLVMNDRKPIIVEYCNYLGNACSNVRSPWCFLHSLILSASI